jgi:hypothetical protein
LGAGCAKSCIPAHAAARARTAAGRGRLSIFQPIGGVYIFIHQLSAANSFSWLYFRRPRAYSPAVYKTRHHLLPSIRPVRSLARSRRRRLCILMERDSRVITARCARIIFAARLFLHSCEPRIIKRAPRIETKQVRQIFGNPYVDRIEIDRMTS